MRKRLIVMGIIGNRVIMGIRKWPNPVCFHLNIQILHTQYVYVFCTHLKGKFVYPAGWIVLHFLKYEFINHKLAVKLHAMGHIGFKI